MACAASPVSCNDAEVFYFGIGAYGQDCRGQVSILQKQAVLLDYKGLVGRFHHNGVQPIDIRIDRPTGHDRADVARASQHQVTESRLAVIYDETLGKALMRQKQNRRSGSSAKRNFKHTHTHNHLLAMQLARRYPVPLGVSTSWCPASG